MSSGGGYAKRREELADAPAPADGAAAGEILSAAGDLLRRSQAVGGMREDIDAALLRIPRSALESWLSMSHVESVHAGLARAFDEAIEAALAETPEERSERASAALAGLAQRDRLESSVAALARYDSLVGLSDTATWPRDKLKKQLADLDRAIRSRARSLVAINDERRQERDLLDDRGSAWWYGARAECDGLVGMLTGDTTKPDAEHLAKCAECRHDLAGAAQVDAPPGRHVSTDDLWRFELGTMTAIEKGRIAKHAERCPDCALALKALDDGERAMEEVG